MEFIDKDTVTAMHLPHVREQTTFWRDPALNNLELLRATYIKHSFAPHIHEGYALGVIDAGAEVFTYRGSKHIAPQGSIVVIHPGEMHTGSAVTEQGWTYRMLYPEIPLVQHAATQIADRAYHLPFFPSPIIHDPPLAALLSQLHTTLEHASSILERESSFLWTLTQLVVRHAQNSPPIRHHPYETGVVQKARRYLEEHYAENVSLSELANAVQLSPFHLLRIFRDTVGLPPHTYLTQLRVLHAKTLLRIGVPLVTVAQASGFTDQSHFTKHFKRIVGVTPGTYASSFLK